MTMELGPNIVDFVQRFQSLQVQRNTTDELIKDLLIYCERVETGLQHEVKRLTDDLHNARLDISDAVDSRRELQQRLRKSTSQIEWLTEENDGLKNRNPYIILLIDGDGLIFKEHWIKQGIEGGKKAAYALRNAIAAECRDRAGDIEIIARVVVNLGGMSRALQRSGAIDNVSEFKDFTIGFAQAKASFDFIDVGYGKERADSKIRELTSWNLRNHNCKQILLGISHDSGYAPFLDEILRDETTRKRITVIEGVPTVNELVATDVTIMNLAKDIFRRDKIVDRSASVPLAQPLTQPTMMVSPSISASSLATPPASVASYAGAITNASPPPQVTLPFTSKPSAKTARQKQEKPAWKPGPRGIDDPINVNLQVMEAVKKRKDSNKLCNNHFLRGPCGKADSCSFVHDYKPTQDEIRAIAVLTRHNPCTNGQDCEAEDCIYGHHCPSVRDGWCTHPFCKFPEELHPPGTKYKTSHITRY